MASNPRPPSRWTSRSPLGLGTVVLVLGLLLTLALAASYAESLRRESRQSLDSAADRFDLIIQSRLEACGNLVRAIQLVLGSNPDMSVEEFDQRLASLRSERSFPALQAAAFARREQDADGSVRYRTRLVAPVRGNEALWELDLSQQPENLRVLRDALDLDEPRLSAPFRLVQFAAADDAFADGIVIRLPLLAPGAVADGPAQRRERELGSIAVSFRVSALVDQMIRALDHPLEYEVQLFADERDGGAPIYSSAASGSTMPGSAELPAASARIDYGGRSWRMRLLPHADWYAQVHRQTALAGLAGALISLLLALFVWSLARTRERAERLALRLNRQAQQSERRFRQLCELLPVATVLARADDGHIEYVNVAGRRLLSVDAGRPGHLGEFGIGAHSADTPGGEIELRRRDGRNFHGGLTESRVEVDDVAMRLVVIEDVTERMQLTAQLRYQASHDALTGLRNRREFDRRLRLAVDARARGEAPMALLYLDLDQFKLVNDTCGHAAGDQLLARIAARLSENVPAGALVARLGGDEFGILLDAASAAAIRAAGERLRAAVERCEFVWEGRAFNLSASIGAVALDGAPSRPAGELLALADTSCYLAKEGGRNRVVVHDEDETATRGRRTEMDWVQRIRQALQDDRFVLYFQELRPLQAGLPDTPHFELLLRMRDEHGEIIPPGVFIPAAERFGVMPAIDRWVVETALRNIDRLHPAGADIGLCAINLSGATLGDAGFPAFLLAQLEASAVAPERLCFEITETAAVADLAVAAGLVRRLRELGCKVALDDFGAGMSSFAYLKNLPVDLIKIDGSFIRELESDSMSQAIVRAVTEIGHQFGVSVVAEFVGRESTRALLAAIGVDYAQGFGVHMPEPAQLFAGRETLR